MVFKDVHFIRFYKTHFHHHSFGEHSISTSFEYVKDLKTMIVICQFRIQRRCDIVVKILSWKCFKIIKTVSDICRWGSRRTTFWKMFTYTFHALCLILWISISNILCKVRGQIIFGLSRSFDYKLEIIWINGITCKIKKCFNDN